MQELEYLSGKKMRPLGTAALPAPPKAKKTSALEQPPVSGATGTALASCKKANSKRESPLLQPLSAEPTRSSRLEISSVKKGSSAAAKAAPGGAETAAHGSQSKALRESWDFDENLD